MDALDHGKQVLAAILRGRKDLLELALKQLTPRHFADPQQANVFELCDRYLANYGLILTRSAVEDMLRLKGTGVALQYGEFVDALLALPADGAFQAHVDQLRELAAERLTGETLAQAMEILRQGQYQGKEFVQGHAAAREHTLAQFGDIERELHAQAAPEGDIRLEAQDIMADYLRRAENKRRGYVVVRTGIEILDNALGGGLQPGELGVIGGPTNVGKSCLCADFCWHCCTVQGKNVVIFTSETNRVQYRAKIIARHSVYLKDHPARPQWAQRFPRGLDTRDLRSGSLTAEAVEFLRDTARHFADKASHGRCYIAQVPPGATIGTLESRLARISRMFPVDLVVIDHLALLRPARRRQSRREELSDTVIEAKTQLAETYWAGRGVPVLSPWHTNREGLKRVQASGGMLGESDLGETADVANAADLVLTLQPDGEDGSAGRRVPVKLGTAKVRDGLRLREPILLDADYATACFTSRAGLSAADALGGLGDEVLA